MGEKRAARTVKATEAKPAGAKKAGAKAAAANKAVVERTSRAVASRGRSRGLGMIVVSESAAELFQETGAVDRVVRALGNNVVAGILGVSSSQPSRWRSGAERIGPQNRRRISDLDHILDRLLLELYPEQASAWLAGPNASLGGARPIDVLELRGPAPVLGAIDALAAGAFA